MTTLIKKVPQLLIKNNLMLVTTESCTGGWIAKIITDQAGSSVYFDRGFVTYSNQAKQDMLNVSEKTLETYGAVSEQVAAEMVIGALQNSPADIAISISGIAGPDGGSEEKPVGTVCFGWMIREKQAITETILFDGDRNSVRKQAVDYCFKGIIKAINELYPNPRIGI